MYTIFVSTFNKKILHVKNGIPIEVGAYGRNNFTYPTHDDTGDNISSENEYYGELTGLYWIWKNIQINDDDIIGFCHYNKALDISQRRAKKFLDSHENAIICLHPHKQSKHEATDEVSGICEVLRRCPADYVAWRNLYDEMAATNGDSCSGCNMLVAKGIVFKDFCSWLFTILSELRIIVGDKPEQPPYLRRYCAFIGERLLSVYIESHHCNTLYVKKQIKEWWIPYLYPIVKCLHLNNCSLLKNVRKLLRANSSYKD